MKKLTTKYLAISLLMTTMPTLCEPQTPKLIEMQSVTEWSIVDQRKKKAIRTTTPSSPSVSISPSSPQPTSSPMEPTPQPVIRRPVSEDLFPAQADLFSDEETEQMKSELEKRQEERRKQSDVKTIFGDLPKATPALAQAPLSDEPILDKQHFPVQQEYLTEDADLEAPEIRESEAQPFFAAQDEHQISAISEHPDDLPELDTVKTTKEIRGEQRQAAQIAVAKTKSAKKFATDKKTAPKVAALEAYTVRGYLNGKSGQEAKQYASSAKKFADIAQNLAKEGKIEQAAKQAQLAQNYAKKAREAAGLKQEKIKQEAKKLTVTIKEVDKQLAETLQKEKELKKELRAEKKITRVLSQQKKEARELKALIKEEAKRTATPSIGTRVKGWLIALFSTKK